HRVLLFAVSPARLRSRCAPASSAPRQPSNREPECRNAFDACGRTPRVETLWLPSPLTPRSKPDIGRGPHEHRLRVEAPRGPLASPRLRGRLPGDEAGDGTGLGRPPL